MMPKRKDLENRLDGRDRTRGALVAPLGLWVEVYPVEHLDPAPREITRARGTGDQPEYPWANDPGGVFVVQGWLRRRGLPPLVRSYDATLEAEDLLTAVTALDVNDDAALLAFVNYWGLLECAKPPRKHVDSVAQTRATLADVQRLARWLSALHHKRWRSRACPTLDEIGHMVGEKNAGQNWSVSRREWPEVLIAAFALDLAWSLGGSVLHPTVTTPRLVLGKPAWLPHGNRLEMQFVVSPERLSEFLYLDLAARDRPHNSVLRACKGCPIVFPIAATNLKKQYHDVACKNRRAFQKWYRRPRNRRVHNARRYRVRGQTAAASTRHEP